MSKPGINLRDLDALRGALAVYVVLGHSRWLLWAGHATWAAQSHAAWEWPLAYASALLRFGREAVMVFFVLSGFFIHLRAAEALRVGARQPFSATAFYRRRTHRLLAPYAFALVVTMVCDAVGYRWYPTLYASGTGDPLLDATFAATGYGWPSVAPALLVLPSSLGRDFGSNGPLWSLAYETVYYALYPLWLATRRRNAWLAFGVVPLACLALAVVPGGGFAQSVMARYPIWLAGAALAESVGWLRPSRTVAAASAVAFVAGILVVAVSPAPLVAIFAAMVFGTAAVSGVAAMPAHWRPRHLLAGCEFLGIRGYTIYIVHFPFLALLSAWVIDTGGSRPLHGWLAAAGGLGAVAFACACFEVCERHFLHERLPAPVAGV